MILKKKIGGFIVNRTPMLRLRLDSKNWVTMAIKEDTTVADAIDRVKKKRYIENAVAEIKSGDQVLSPETKLYDIIHQGPNLQFSYKLPEES